MELSTPERLQWDDLKLGQRSSPGRRLLILWATGCLVQALTSMWFLQHHLPRDLSSRRKTERTGHSGPESPNSGLARPVTVGASWRETEALSLD